MTQSKVPVYMPDRTQVGTAEVDIASGKAEIKLDVESPIAELIQESLVGLSIVILDRDAVHEVLNKEKTDESNTSTEEVPLDRRLHDQESQDPLA